MACASLDATTEELICYVGKIDLPAFRTPVTTLEIHFKVQVLPEESLISP